MPILRGQPPVNLTPVRAPPPGLEPGESIPDGLRREDCEETGADIEPDRLTPVYPNRTGGIVALVSRAHATEEATRLQWLTPGQARDRCDRAYVVRVLDASSDTAPAIRAHDGVHLTEPPRSVAEFDLSRIKAPRKRGAPHQAASDEGGAGGKSLRRGTPASRCRSRPAGHRLRSPTRPGRFQGVERRPIVTNDDPQAPRITPGQGGLRPIDQEGDGRVDLYAGFCRRRRGTDGRPSISACRRRQAPAAYPQARAGSPRTPARAPPRGGALLGLAPGGVYRATPVTRSAGGLLPHRFTLTDQPVGGLFSVALSRGSPRVAVSNRPALWSPDVPRRGRSHRRGRPVDSSVRINPTPAAGPLGRGERLAWRTSWSSGTRA